MKLITTLLLSLFITATVFSQDYKYETSEPIDEPNDKNRIIPAFVILLLLSFYFFFYSITCSKH